MWEAAQPRCNLDDDDDDDDVCWLAFRLPDKEDIDHSRTLKVKGTVFVTVNSLSVFN